MRRPAQAGLRGDRERVNFRPNTLFLNDNLPVLRGMDGGYEDLIYLDPPFTSKREYKETGCSIGSTACPRRAKALPTKIAHEALL